MTDKEILELVAKAVGGTFSPGTCRHRIGPTWDDWEWIGPMGIEMPSGLVIYPLTDSLDNAVIGAALRIRHTWHSDGVVCGFCWAASTELFDKHSGDKQSALRKARLRVAAQIGKAMP